mmetsp:Transcript_24698/g.62710  ORF Transcript_24698/g.62710 Transcript_24698/m.62710 type:complete len:227 (+) Transcript_24698:465-1145(+)
MTCAWVLRSSSGTSPTTTAPMVPAGVDDCSSEPGVAPRSRPVTISATSSRRSAEGLATCLMHMPSSSCAAQPLPSADATPTHRATTAPRCVGSGVATPLNTQPVRARCVSESREARMTPCTRGSISSRDLMVSAGRMRGSMSVSWDTICPASAASCCLCSCAPELWWGDAMGELALPTDSSPAAPSVWAAPDASPVPARTIFPAPSMCTASPVSCSSRFLSSAACC